MWLFEDSATPTGLLHGPAGMPRSEQRNVAARYEDLRPGTYEQTARLADMDVNHVEAAINFPNIFPRFCGQGFLERDDKELAAECLRIYNDWMIDDWGSGAGRGRLIPLALLPLWDRKMAAAEVRRCAAKGCFAVAFSENPSKLGLPSMYTGAWDPVWQACEESDTTVSMHIGSSSSMPSTSADAPLATSMSLYAQNAEGSMVDWVFSGTLQRFKQIKITYAESQVGWMPFQVERMDSVFREGRGGVGGDGPLPSEVVQGRVFGCIFDDLVGLKQRHDVGIDQILFETDYPHSRRHLPAFPQGGPLDVRGGGDERCRVLQGASGQRHQRLRAVPLRHPRLADARRRDCGGSPALEREADEVRLAGTTKGMTDA